MLKNFLFLILPVLVSGCYQNKGKEKSVPITEDSPIIIETSNYISEDSISTTELTDYGEPFPIDVVKESIYYNGGKELQKNISLKDLFGEWEFERDIKVIYRFNPDMTYTETKEDNLIDEVNNSKPDKKVKKGRFSFKDNVLTLLDYHKKEDLHPTDWQKYKNPLNHELVVFSIKGDTLLLYESGRNTDNFIRKR